MNSPQGAFDQFLRGLGTLDQKRKLKLVAERTFLVTLLQQFDVVVRPSLARTLSVKLQFALTSISDSREKLLLQQQCAQDPVAAEFVGRLASPGPHAYRGGAPWRWASAGYLPIFKIEGVRYVALFLRELKSIPGWNVATGASETLVELRRPQLTAEREAKAELIVVDTRTERCYRLERPGGTVDVASHHKRVLAQLSVQATVDAEPLLGAIVAGQPDLVHVLADWEHGHGPFVSEHGFILFNHEDGEAGIEFIQVVEWELPAKLDDLRFYDGEVHEYVNLNDGKAEGKPVQQPIGLFAVDELIAEFQKPLPQPQPQIVYDRGVVRDGARLAQWLREPPHSPAAQHWCPVTRKVIQRYFTEVCQIGNRFFQKPSGAWQLSYAGETVELPNRRGLQHLARLIRYQGKELHCALLANGGVEPAATLAPPTPALSAAQLAAEHLVIERVPAREESARRQVLRKLDADLQALKTDRADADAASDSAELARLEAAIEEKKQEIAKVIRWFQKHGAIRAGKTTGAGNPRQEKDRQAVSTAIRRSLAVLKTKHPKLWQHLAGTLQLGFYCQYAPATHLHWRL